MCWKWAEDWAGVFVDGMDLYCILGKAVLEIVMKLRMEKTATS